MTATIMKNIYCDQIETKKSIKAFCKANDLYFKDDNTYNFGFSIVKRIPYTNTGFFFRLINGRYINKYICDGVITEDNVVEIFFQPVKLQPNGTDRLMDPIVHYLNSVEFTAEITYPCDYKA